MRAPKNKNNEFGGYKYRNAEGILAAFKGLGIDGAALLCSDTLQEVAGHIFVTATARLTIGAEFVEAQGHAMHPLQKKGMDASQITGSASSYARKYALCGLFAIEDESQDPDSKDNTKDEGKGANKAASPKVTAPIIADIEATTTGQELLAVLKKIGDKNDIPEIAQARIDRIVTLVKGAQTVAVIDAFAKAFGPDWSHVEAHATARKNELQSTAARLGDDIPEHLK
jgi:hypothetical protein